jgi:hypothetical protein
MCGEFVMHRLFKIIRAHVSRDFAMASCTVD